MPLLAFGSPKLSLSTSSTGGWQELEFPEKPFGGVGEVYEKFVEGGKGSVDFEEAVKRHRMVDAMRRSLETGKSESYL